MRYQGLLIGLLLTCWLQQVHARPVESAQPIMDQMLRAMDNIVTLSGHLKRSERLLTGMINGECTFKVNAHPQKIYMHMLAPEAGAEILYCEGWNDNKAFIHPNKFPWVNVSLSPYASNFAEKQHHSLLEAGFGFMASILRHLLQEYGADFDAHVRNAGKKTWYGKEVDVLEFNNPDYAFIPYTVKAGEDLVKLQHRLMIPAYKILEINPKVEDKFDVTAGQVIQIPNHYAKQIVVFVDPDLHLPVVQIVTDDKGLFEKYEFGDLKVNPRFTTMEFNEDNEQYGF